MNALKHLLSQKKVNETPGREITEKGEYFTHEQKLTEETEWCEKSTKKQNGHSNDTAKRMPE